ncbi:hypothetical protein WJ61_30645 [Burkholderia ubonensis]|uniref:hypothetical protein n=1 Tax=Burkholderia ubonensis TaxID=101571 RepID=UPI00075A3A46|nr:hypothetical protein [Burkholderia ubonensis]KVM66027.1 hypothetical protein WJ61_30645 [Burkholderia ubonensis]
MYRIDDATAATSLPAPEVAGSEGYYTEGNPVAGMPATNVRASWLNMIQEELCSILAAAGIARSKTSYNQVNAALRAMYAPPIGAARNLKASCAANATSITFTADQIVVGTALNGQTFVLPSFNKTLSLGTTGAGGMDTGTATAGGWLAVYAIYNPTSATAALLGTMETSAAATSVYSGANMPAGYTASALLAVIPVSSTAGQLRTATVLGRLVCVPNVLTLQTSSIVGSPTGFSLAGAVPKAAVRVSGQMVVTSTAVSSVGMNVASDSGGVLGYQNVSQSGGTSGTGNYSAPIITPQTLYYTTTNTAGTPTCSFYVSYYEI